MTDRIPDVLVHLTPTMRVPDILCEGLRVNMPRTSTGKKPKAAVYLALHADILRDDCEDGVAYATMTTLYVDVSTFKHLLKPDGEWRPEDHNNPEHLFGDMAWYIEQDIAPEFVSVVMPEGYVELDPFRD
jgi:hypothetical protein